MSKYLDNISKQLRLVSENINIKSSDIIEILTITHGSPKSINSQIIKFKYPETISYIIGHILYDYNRISHIYMDERYHLKLMKYYPEIYKDSVLRLMKHYSEIYKYSALIFEHSIIDNNCNYYIECGGYSFNFSPGKTHICNILQQIWYKYFHNLHPCFNEIFEKSEPKNLFSSSASDINININDSDSNTEVKINFIFELNTDIKQLNPEILKLNI